MNIRIFISINIFFILSSYLYSQKYHNIYKDINACYTENLCEYEIVYSPFSEDFISNIDSLKRINNEDTIFLFRSKSFFRQRLDESIIWNRSDTIVFQGNETVEFKNSIFRNNILFSLVSKWDTKRIRWYANINEHHEASENYIVKIIFHENEYDIYIYDFTTGLITGDEICYKTLDYMYINNLDSFKITKNLKFDKHGNAYKDNIVVYSEELWLLNSNIMGLNNALKVHYDNETYYIPIIDSISDVTDLYSTLEIGVRIQQIINNRDTTYSAYIDKVRNLDKKQKKENGFELIEVLLYLPNSNNDEHDEYIIMCTYEGVIINEFTQNEKVHHSFSSYDKLGYEKILELVNNIVEAGECSPKIHPELEKSESYIELCIDDKYYVSTQFLNFSNLPIHIKSLLETIILNSISSKT